MSFELSVIKSCLLTLKTETFVKIACVSVEHMRITYFFAVLLDISNVLSLFLRLCEAPLHEGNIKYTIEQMFAIIYS